MQFPFTKSSQPNVHSNCPMQPWDAERSQFPSKMLKIEALNCKESYYHNDDT